MKRAAIQFFDESHQLRDGRHRIPRPFLLRQRVAAAAVVPVKVDRDQPQPVGAGDVELQVIAHHHNPPVVAPGDAQCLQCDQKDPGVRLAGANHLRDRQRVKEIEHPVLLEHVDRRAGLAIRHQAQDVPVCLEAPQHLGRTWDHVGLQRVLASILDLRFLNHQRVAQVEQQGSQSMGHSPASGNDLAERRVVQLGPSKQRTGPCGRFTR